MERVVVVGGGGHAKVIIEILQDDGALEIVGCTISGARTASVCGVSVLGDDSELPQIYASGVRYAFIAVGDNRVRRSLAHKALALGFSLAKAISPRAVVSPRAEVADGAAIMAGAVINSCARLGTGSIINTSVSVDHDCSIGDWVHIAPGTNLAGCVTVEEGAFMGIGSRAIPGITIGAWSVVGAGAVVVRDVPAGVTAIGVPARVKNGERQ